jgi:glycosyltransferase involved in cell wall biosynthesis
MSIYSPLISIVIPTYNHAHFLSEALGSVTKQTYSNWEVVVVNNYSEDDTINVVAGINDPRIRLVNFKNNGVIGASRNEGIRRAQGEYIAFLDSDDIWYPNKLEFCLEALRMGYDLVCHKLIFRYEDGTLRNTNYRRKQTISYERLLYQDNCITPSATIVSKIILDKVEGFSEDPAFTTAEDYELWLRIAKVSSRLYFLDKELGVYRIHGANASLSTVRHMQATLAVLERHQSSELQKIVWSDVKYRKQCSRIIISSAWIMSCNRGADGVYRTIGGAIKKWPFNWKAYAVILLTSISMLKNLGRSIFFRENP